MSKKMTMKEAGRLGGIASREYSKRKKDERMQEYNKSPKLCKSCKKHIPYEEKSNVFCSRSCGATYTNLNRIRKDAVLISGCKSCETPTKNKKFCCQICQWDYSWTKRKEKIVETGNINYEKNPITANVDDRCRRIAKKFLLEERGNICEICKRSEWMGKKIPLSVDHIDGKHGNNLVINLRLICANCDMQLDTFGAKNKGEGRKWRKGYSEGRE